MTKDYYAENADKIKATAKKWTERQRSRLKAFVIGLKSEAQCIGCKQTFPWYCITFGDDEIPRMVRKGVSVITMAGRISEDRAYCANCRRIKQAGDGALTDRVSLS